MPKSREERLAQRKEYREKNKERLKSEFKELYKKNRECELIRMKVWKDNNPKLCRINKWKLRGIIDGDFDSFYEYWIKETNCMICGIKYSKSNHKCVDHDWSIKNDDNIRYICCRNCNVHVVG